MFLHVIDGEVIDLKKLFAVAGLKDNTLARAGYIKNSSLSQVIFD